MSPGIPPRFAIRQVGASWTVYNWFDLEPACVESVAQIGLDRDTAAMVADRLNRDILRDRGQRSEQRPSPPKSRALTVGTGAEAA